MSQWSVTIKTASKLLQGILKALHQIKYLKDQQIRSSQSGDMESEQGAGQSSHSSIRPSSVLRIIRNELNIRGSSGGRFEAPSELSDEDLPGLIATARDDIRRLEESEVMILRSHPVYKDVKDLLDN